MNGTATVIAAVLGVAGVSVGAFFTWKATKRATSGRVNTTEAGQLWAESSAIRREAVERAEKLQKDFDDLRDAYSLLAKKCLEQDIELGKLRKENDDNHRVMSIMRNELIEMRVRVGLPPTASDDVDPHEAPKRASPDKGAP